MSELRKYECEHYSVLAPPTCCLFCNHCTDVFWDHTNGPYLFFCEEKADTTIGAKGECESFEEEVSK